MVPNDDKVLEFSELLQSSRSRVFGFIYALVLNIADAEDLFQQTAGLLWEKFDEYESGSDFASWALRIARFKTSNFLRGRYRENKRLSNTAIESLYEASLETQEASHQERLDALRRCMTKLSTTERGLVQKCYGGVQQIKEIAVNEGKTANAVYASLHRIRRSLLECIKSSMAMADQPSPSTE